jgi:hypothetical protein
MPVTIGRLTSEVEMVDGAAAGATSGPAFERLMEKILARLREEERARAREREGREIRDRMSSPDLD